MKKFNTHETHTKCDNCANINNKIRLVSIPRNKENGCCSFTSIGMDLIKAICMLLLEGCYLDKMSTMLNQKILKLLIDECRISMAESVEYNSKTNHASKSVCKIVPDDGDDTNLPVIDNTKSNNNNNNAKNNAMVLKINMRRMMQNITDNKIVFSMPFHLLDGDAESKHITPKRAIQLDLHERILFQSLHLWNSITDVDRELIILKIWITQYPKASRKDLEYVRNMAMFSKEIIFNLIMRARGIYLKESHPEVHKERSSNNGFMNNFRNIKQGNVGPSPFYVPDPCPCAEEYYMTRLCKRFDETISSKKDTVEHISNLDISEFRDCEKMTEVLVKSLLCLWNGIGNLELVDEKNNTVSLDKLSINVEFKVLPSDHSFIKKLSAPDDKGQLILPCNHVGVKKHVFRLFYYSDTYCAHDSVIENARRYVMLRPILEDNHFVIVAPDDSTMNSRLTEMENLYTTALASPKYTQELTKHIDFQFPKVQRYRTLKEKITWVMFELMFRRNCDLFPVLSPTRIPTNPNTERFMLTFGLVTEDDKRWSENDKIVETAIAEFSMMNALFKERMRRDIEQDFEKDQDKKQKQQQKRAKNRAKKKVKMEQQKEQQRLNNNEEDDEDEEDEEEEEVKSDNSSVVVQQQPAPSMVESDPIKVKFERTFSKAIGSENKQKEQEQYRREIENLISEATFYYLTD